jgi:aspartyl-tRNA(Asn)/glutamyl-tRNA(Gln) amidotransferase subunit A
MNDLHWMTLVEAAGAIAARKLSPVELMSALLKRIGRLDPKLNVFIRLDREAAMEEARAAEAEIVSGRVRGPLHGVPVGIKDIIDVAGLPTTCHSKILIDNVAASDAVCVSRLRGAGAIVLGKLSTHEFAIGGPSFDLPWPPARNPWNTIIIPAARPRDQGLALLPACSRWRWAATQAAACATRPAPAASSGSSRLTA